MIRRRSNKDRPLRAVAVAFGVLTLGIGASTVAAVSTAVAEGVVIEVPVTTPRATPSPTTETPVTVPVGTTVADATFEIALVGLEPFAFVEVYSNSEPVLIASGFADANGDFSAVVALPPNLAPGDHTITAVSVLADGSKTTITVVEFAVTASGRIAKPGSATSGSGVVTGDVTEDVVTDEQEVDFLASNPLNLSGVFYVGGFRAAPSYDTGGLLSPGASISLYINNVHSEAASGTVAFWVTNPLGMVVAESKPYSIRPIAPGETRIVGSRFADIGQWGGYTTHLRFTPDEAVSAGIDTPYLRSDTLIVFSWVLTTVGALVTAGFVATRFPPIEQLRRRIADRFREVMAR